MENNGNKKKEIKPSKKLMAQAIAVSERLIEIYPEAQCALEFDGEPWKLMVMGRLSAQCTDKRVNEVSRTLFERFPTASDLANGDISEIEVQLAAQYNRES